MQSNRPIHTYSIVALDPVLGELGVAVQSHWFSVGSVVPWAEAGVGAVATQSFTNPSFGPRGLEQLKTGCTAAETVRRLIETDNARDLRQLAIVDSLGGVGAYTGRRCIPEAGHLLGENYAVQANLMLSNQVWPAMAKAFERSAGQSAPALAERMLVALEAAQSCGGDLRGQQSAALLVVRARATGDAGKDRLIDLRVEDSPNPLEELGRLLRICRAYGHMNRGDQATEEKDTARALEHYRQAQALCPENGEMRFWYAVSLTSLGKIAEARSVLQALYRQEPQWKLLAERIERSGIWTAPGPDEPAQ